MNKEGMAATIIAIVTIVTTVIIETTVIGLGRTAKDEIMVEKTTHERAAKDSKVAKIGPNDPLRSKSTTILTIDSSIARTINSLWM
jgi:hypothetical protein